VNAFIEELRIAREGAGLTQEQLAEATQYSQGQISKIENGERVPNLKFAKAADDALKTGGLLHRTLRRELRQETTPAWFVPWLERERQATSLRTYQPLLIPGLLQIEEYAMALLQDETRVATRLDRQETLDQLDTFVVVIDEAALTRPIGGADVMVTQLQRLLEDTRASVHVVPAATGYYTGLDGAFTIAVIDGTEVAVLDNRLRGQFIELPEDMAVIRRAWEAVRSEALPRGQSRDLIEEACDRWKT